MAAARNPMALLERLSRHGATFTTKISSEQAQWHTKIVLKINEAKNLPAKDINGSSDAFCLVSVDDELIARTSTVWKTLNPFFGEEFTFDLSNNFQKLEIRVMDQDKRTNNDPIGKLSFSRDKLINDASLALDTWYPLAKICKETTVHGEVFVELLLSETDTGIDELTVTVVKGRDLSPKDGTSKMDTYAVVKLDEQQHTTDKIKATKYPYWNQVFRFERAKLGPELTVTIRGTGGIGGSSFLGEAIIPLKDLNKDIPVRQWYRLEPREKDLEGLRDGHGSLRCSVKFSYELVLPLESYSGLLGFLKDSVNSPEDISTKLIAIVQEILLDRDKAVDARETIPRTLVRLLLSENKCITFLKHLNGMEIAQHTESSTLFRGNSLATKCTDLFMKAVGLGYLHETLKPLVDDVFREKKDCEIDEVKLPKKMQNPEVIAKHAAQLQRYLEKLLDALFASASQCPPAMRLVFKNIREAVQQNDAMTKSQSDSTVGYTAVSGFLFLRFFAPAILSPKLFGMREHLADAKTARTLTILAKAVQAIGNLGSSIGSGKEQYMKPLHGLIMDNVAKVRAFIDEICDQAPVDQSTLAMLPGQQMDAVLAEGMFPVRIDSGAFQKRHLTLTLGALHHEKPRDEATRDMMKIDGLLAAERMDSSAFDKKFCIGLIHQHDPPLYINLNTEEECDAWLQLFRKACHASHACIQPVVHAGVIKGGRWTCCKYKDADTVFPCSKTHSTVLLDQFSDDPRLETWLHVLFNFLLSAKPKLESKYQDQATLAPADAPKYEACQQLFRILDDINLMHLLSQEASPKT